MDKAKLAIVQKIIETEVRRRFGKGIILSVRVRPDVDEDGDRVIFVTVVFNSDGEPLDTAKTSSLARHVLPRIAEVMEDTFPIFSFVDKSEARYLT
jgi:hypothetical protein